MAVDDSDPPVTLVLMLVAMLPRRLSAYMSNLHSMTLIVHPSSDQCALLIHVTCVRHYQ